ncbi:two-component sensor histidine kinase [Arenimonas maotaiensis]|uniref:histidine kinase n=1 Tax=Arenimonas maotaiensis TaxID=1446479 RepID=A0A917CIV5_9GAMM|nr:ATP-binding protein [Arenimonas maotaiensis]GGF87890.1 two-component sensor histidine kinase [Arenimonas maotaiensis]
MFPMRRALSLHARQLIAASLGLIAFLGLTGMALDQAFRNSLVDNMEARMARHADAYWNKVGFDRRGRLLPAALDKAPDARFNEFRSGLYAQIQGEGVNWQSQSVALFSLPALPAREVGDAPEFDGPLPLPIGEDIRINAYRYTDTLRFETKSGPRVLTLHIYESEEEIFKQIAEYRRTLWGYLGIAGVLLVLVQIAILRWSLQPLRVLESEMQALQSGRQARLGRRYPTELGPIAGSINALLDSERGNLEMSRNTLADLAHSLKTPLAVLQSQIDNGDDPAQFKREVYTQLQRMNDIVSYQLSRAARAGHALYSAPIDVLPHAESIVASLEKIHRAKGVYCEFEIDPKSQFSGEAGDLQELLGNFLENAFKWAARRVLLTVRPVYEPGAKRPGLHICVEDDGPGIAPEDIGRILQRGVRGDERVQGHGIGMAIVQDIVRSYHGTLSVDRSQELGGARFAIDLPCLA